MAKAIQYPTQEWLDRWVDAWLDKHPNEKVTDFAELTAQAEDAWWLNEIEHNRATPFDLTPEQEQASKQARKGAKADKERKPTTRERKPNYEKRELMELLAQFLVNRDITDAVVTNAEKTIDFHVGENSYTFTLTCHRKPKG